MPWLSAIVSNVVLASFVAAVAWYVQRRLRWHAVARLLWVLVLIKLITPPVVSVPVVELPQALACGLGACHCGPHAGVPTFVSHTLPWIVLAAWLAGAGVNLLLAWRRWAQLQRLISLASPAPPAWQSLAARLSDELSLRPPKVLAMPGTLPPFVVGRRWRPCILVPIKLMHRLSRSQKKAMLLHELAHIKRRDHLVRVLEIVVRIAFWWFPAIHSIGRQLRACEESCCDATVVNRLPQARRDYARLLLDVIDFAEPLPPRLAPQATAMSAAEGIEKRLLSILDAREGTRRGRTAAALAMGLACVVLPCGMHCEIAGPEMVPLPMTPANAEVCEPTSESTWRAVCEPAPRLPVYCCPRIE